MQLTIYQQKVVEAVRDRVEMPGNKPGLLVEALAGTGKSTTLKLIAVELNSLGVLPSRCRFLVFGKKNSLDLKEKFKAVGPSWDKSVQTLNSLGYSILRDGIGRSHRYFRLKSSKYLGLAKDLGYLTKTDEYGNCNPGSLTYSENSPIQSDRHFTELIEKLRLHCYAPGDIDIKAIAAMDDRYGWEFRSSQLEEIARAAKHCLLYGIERVNDGLIDFLDQLYYPWLNRSQFAATFEAWAKQLKFIAIDEAQDTDNLQIDFLKLLHRPINNFLCAVGDRHQAVYYFRGCLSNGLDVISREFSCQSLPLPINYRCGKNHLQLVREIFPNIKIESHDNAPPGEIRCIKNSQLLEMVANRSLSYFGVSRKNAPLLSTAIKFLTAGIPAKIKDKSLGDKVLSTVKRVTGKKYNPDTFLDKLENWEIQQLKRYKSESKHQEITDLSACLKALFDAFELDSLKAWEGKLSEIFDESKTNEKPIDLYSIHSGKGGEGEISFIINPADMPIEFKSQTDEERAQEDNMIYVALTRCAANSKDGSGILYFVLQESKDKTNVDWPTWLPKKYRNLWNEPPKTESDEIKNFPDDCIDAAREESGLDEVAFDSSDVSVWSCPVCEVDNVDSDFCFQCGYELPKAADDSNGLGSSLEFERKPKTKTEQIKNILLSGSDLSGEQIAAQVGCSSMLVSKTRKKLENEGLLEAIRTVRTADGRIMTVGNIGTVPESEKSKLDRARDVLEDLTGEELRLLFSEFLGDKNRF